jgi:hypothetical protein
VLGGGGGGGDTLIPSIDRVSLELPLENFFILPKIIPPFKPSNM